MRGHTPYFELREALGQEGCPVCALTVRALERFFAGLVYERVNDRELRAEIRQGYGLCATHGSMMRAARSALGVAIIQRDVLRAAAAAVRADPGERQGRGWRAVLRPGHAPAEVLRPAGPCVACRLADETADHWIGVLGQHYLVLRPDFQASGGLCLTHLSQALGAAPAEVLALLRDDQLAIWARWEQQLDEFIRKHDHQFAAEPMGAERDVWSRVSALLAGDERALGSRRTRG